MTPFGIGPVQRNNPIAEAKGLRDTTPPSGALLEEPGAAETGGFPARYRENLLGKPFVPGNEVIRQRTGAPQALPSFRRLNGLKLISG